MKSFRYIDPIRLLNPALNRNNKPINKVGLPFINSPNRLLREDKY